MLKPGEQLADSDGSYLAGRELQGAAFRPERGFGLDDDARALGQRSGHCIEDGGADRDVERHVDVRVPQREVCGGLSRTAADLDYLPFNPQG